MSVGLFGLFIVWVIDGDLKSKIKAFCNNKTALLISSIYLITVLGLIHTSNFEFALDDLRRKLPLFFIPFFVAGFSPVTKKEFHALLHLYILGVLLATFWSLFVYLGGLGESIIDTRELSRFNSHIRFGLEIAFAIFISLYLLFTAKNNKEKLFWLFISAWFISSFVLFSLFSGLVVFAISSFCLLISLNLQAKNVFLKHVSINIFMLLIAGSVYFFKNTLSEFNHCRIEKTIEEIPFTSLKNNYRIDQNSKASTLRENGYLVDKNIADKEFSDAWNNKSTLKYEALDLKGNEIKFTLRRFITSKGLRKDKAAIDSLSATEIEAIENGVSNYKYLELGYFQARIFKILWEYQSYKEGRSINGHSVLMRWEYWKTAIEIITENMFFGVGTGDVQDAFNAQYDISESTLEKKYRLRTHNQFLAYGVSLGSLGILSFLFLLFYPVIKLNYYKNNIYFAFLSIMILSMLTEDMLEVHAGINFFAFFNALFLLKSKDNISHDNI